MTTEKIHSEMADIALACHFYYSGVRSTPEQRDKTVKFFAEMFPNPEFGEDFKAIAADWQRKMDAEEN
jgi:hypothetical protein